MMAPEAPTPPPWSGLYNSPLNQPGRRSRSRAEPGALRGESPNSALNLGAVRRLNPLAFGNTVRQAIAADSRQPIADSRKLSHYPTVSLSHYPSFHFLKKSTAALLR